MRGVSGSMKVEYSSAAFRDLIRTVHRYIPQAARARVRVLDMHQRTSSGRSSSRQATTAAAPAPAPAPANSVHNHNLHQTDNKHHLHDDADKKRRRRTKRRTKAPAHFALTACRCSAICFFFVIVMPTYHEHTASTGPPECIPQPRRRIEHLRSRDQNTRLDSHAIAGVLFRCRDDLDQEIQDNTPISLNSVMKHKGLDIIILSLPNTTRSARASRPESLIRGTLRKLGSRSLRKLGSRSLRKLGSRTLRKLGSRTLRKLGSRTLRKLGSRSP